MGSLLFLDGSLGIYTLRVGAVCCRCAGDVRVKQELRGTALMVANGANGEGDKGDRRDLPGLSLYPLAAYLGTPNTLAYFSLITFISRGEALSVKEPHPSQ